MIDKKIQEELNNKYNPEGSDLRMHQLRMLEILKFIDSFCRENNINYWLSSGTCLGAIRHGGFIPWDDDIDIEMLRDDYLKFQVLFKETDKYVFQTPQNDRFYNIPFGKVREKNTFIYDSLFLYRGIFVDVFCLESINRCSSLWTRRLFSYTINFLYAKCKRMDRSGFYFNILSALFDFSKWIVFKVVSIIRVIDKIGKNGELRHTLGTGWSDNIRKKEEIFPLKECEFEGCMFFVPGNSDAYLKRIFGDYMEIPTHENIKPPHVQYFN